MQDGPVHSTQYPTSDSYKHLHVAKQCLSITLRHVIARLTGSQHGLRTGNHKLTSALI